MCPTTCPSGQLCDSGKHVCVANTGKPVGLCVFDLDGTLIDNREPGPKNGIFQPCIDKNFGIAISTKGTYASIKDLCTNPKYKSDIPKLPPMLCDPANWSTFQFMKPTNKAEAMYNAATAMGIDPSKAILFDDDYHNLDAVTSWNAAHHTNMQAACSGLICTQKGYQPHSTADGGRLTAEWVKDEVAKM